MPLLDEGTGLRALLIPEDEDRFAASFLLEQVDGGWQLTGHRWDRFEPAMAFGELGHVIDHVQGVALAASRAGGSTRLN